jgi:hypothetical protein
MGRKCGWLNGWAIALVAPQPGQTQGGVCTNDCGLDGKASP